MDELDLVHYKIHIFIFHYCLGTQKIAQTFFCKYRQKKHEISFLRTFYLLIPQFIDLFVFIFLNKYFINDSTKINFQV